MNDSSTGNSLQRNMREISERQKIAPALTAHLDAYFAEIDADNFVEREGKKKNVLPKKSPTTKRKEAKAA